MNQKVQKLIEKYQRHLNRGEDNLRNLIHLGKEASLEYQQQRSINGIWHMFLNDLASLTDNYQYDDSQKK